MNMIHFIFIHCVCDFLLQVCGKTFLNKIDQLCKTSWGPGSQTAQLIYVETSDVPNPHIEYD